MEIRIRGKSVRVPSVQIHHRTVIVTGGWLKTAVVYDEELIEGDAVGDPELFIRAVRESGVGADLFAFSQPVAQSHANYSYRREWDNAAAIPITTFDDWWNERSHDLRKDVRRAAKRGVVVRPVSFEDTFVRGIIDIYNEIPVRQGRAFWHYGKSFEQVRQETATYLERSEFLGAYLGNELIGFLKLVYVGKVARLMFILAKAAHRDKRPTNALIAKAVEICATRKCSHLTYGKFEYEKSAHSTLATFKHRNGFQKVLYPRYFVPLTVKGKLGLRLNLHHGVKALVPSRLLDLGRAVRADLLKRHVSTN